MCLSIWKAKTDMAGWDTASSSGWQYDWSRDKRARNLFPCNSWQALLWELYLYSKPWYWMRAFGLFGYLLEPGASVTTFKESRCYYSCIWISAPERIMIEKCPPGISKKSLADRNIGWYRTKNTGWFWTKSVVSNTSFIPAAVEVIMPESCLRISKVI